MTAQVSVTPRSDCFAFRRCDVQFKAPELLVVVKGPLQTQLQFMFLFRKQASVTLKEEPL